MVRCLYFYVKRITDEIKHEIIWKYVESFFQPKIGSVSLKTEWIQIENDKRK